ncbi:MAG: glycosyltransferase [Candidatus Levybacteria bacterium]|nr:glycosyltransferase [Candidatus Levybacteria bacterium]
MTKKIEVSIIIVHYKIKKLLINCLESIYENTKGVNFEIIVVDNDERKSIRADLKQRFPRIKYIPNKNLGFAQGNNVGTKKASGEYLFFLNPDTRVLENSIDKLYEFLEKHKKVGIVSPLLVDKQLKPFSTQSRKELTVKEAIYSFSFLRKLFPHKSIYNDPFFKKWGKKRAIEVDAIPGAALLISKKLFSRIDGFDENFFLYFEENDLSKRVRNLGYKLYINPKSKIIHQVGQSTNNLKNTEKIFRKSQFYYFRKWYGFLPALIVQIVTSINKYSLILLGILILSLFLRTHRLDELMTFIGDQGWFYISARDMVLTGEIPLVGITASHTWLHQGALWTYILAILFKLFNFNPLYGAYFTAFLGVFSVFLVYKIGSVMFSSRVGIISSFLYATSPLVIFHARFPYHTSPIPFFTILFIFSIYKWIKGNMLFFPISIFLLAVLYNLELATFSFVVTFILVFIFGFFKKTKWVMGVINKKILTYTFFAFLIPMFPMIVYDLFHGFPQTLKFIVWIFYKIAVFLGYPPLHPEIPGETWITFFSFNSVFIQKLIFFASKPTSFIILVLSLVLLTTVVLKQIKNKQYKLSYILIFVLFFIPSIGFILQKTNSEAYLPIFFPTAVIILGISFDYFLRERLFLLPIFFIILFVGISNSFLLIKQNYFVDITFNDRTNAAKQIIKEANGRPYNLIGKGAGSQHRSFTMNYEFLTWYFGHGPSDKKEKLQFIISEQPYKIEIEKKEK